MKVYLWLSKQAEKTIREELRRFPEKETGGVLFGKKFANLWFATDACGSGHNSQHSTCNFIMDMDYAQCVTEAICGKSVRKSILGIWHKHNHNLHPVFSEEDIHTGTLYAKLNSFGAVSLIACKLESGYTLCGEHIMYDGYRASLKIYDRGRKNFTNNLLIDYKTETM